MPEWVCALRRAPAPAREETAGAKARQLRAGHQGRAEVAAEARPQQGYIVAKADPMGEPIRLCGTGCQQGTRSGGGGGHRQEGHGDRRHRERPRSPLHPLMCRLANARIISQACPHPPRQSRGELTQQFLVPGFPEQGHGQYVIDYRAPRQRPTSMICAASCELSARGLSTTRSNPASIAAGAGERGWRLGEPTIRSCRWVLLASISSRSAASRTPGYRAAAARRRRGLEVAMAQRASSGVAAIRGAGRPPPPARTPPASR